jgi:putative ABC transport system substrate-binding protein
MLAAELVRLKVDVMVVGASSAARAARQATAAIPIVMASGNPLEAGYAASLGRPGGNVTGLTSLTVELSAKRLELAREIVPGATRLAILGTGSPGAMLYVRETEAAARARGVRLHVATAKDASELDGAFSSIVRERPAVLIVIPSPLFFAERQRLAELAVTHRLPTVYSSREFVEAGGLIAYGVSLTDLYRRVATYVDRILKGAKPADLPIEQPTKFDLLINAKTAKAIGLTLPPALLSRADEIIR